MGLLINFIQLVFFALQLAILARVLLSFINPNPYHPVVRLIYQMTEPILGPLRRVIPPLGMFDITPIVALIILNIVQQVIVSLLVGRF